MPTITIRNIDDSLKSILRMRAASHDRSIEEGARLHPARGASKRRAGTRHVVSRIFSECRGCRIASAQSNRKSAEAGKSSVIFLDTKTISEVMRPAPDTTVIAWMDHQMRGEIGVTAVHHAKVVVGREQIGAPISMADAQIAAICLAYSARYT